MTNDITSASRIKSDLQGDLADCNHVVRRYFGLWLEGSYEGNYERFGGHKYGSDQNLSNKAYLREALLNHGTGIKMESSIRSWVVANFCQYMATDAHCSVRYAQTVIVKEMRDKVFGLSELTEVLISDALDLIEEDILEHNCKSLKVSA